MKENQIDIKEFKKFHDFGQEMYKDTMAVFMKYIAKDVKYAFLHMQSMPINIFFNMLEVMEESGVDDFMKEADVPGIFIRMMKPMEKIADQWGKMSVKEFNELYRKEYSAVMNERFPEEGALFETMQEKMQKEKGSR